MPPFCYSYCHSKWLTSGSLKLISCFLIISITLHKQAAVPLKITRWQCLCVCVSAFVPDVLGNRYIACLQWALRTWTEINWLNLFGLKGYLAQYYLSSILLHPFFYICFLWKLLIFIVSNNFAYIYYSYYYFCCNLFWSQIMICETMLYVTNISDIV